MNLEEACILLKNCAIVAIDFYSRLRSMDVYKQISLGEDSCHQFKEDIHNVDSLASEIAAFANAEGGIIFIGVTDRGDPIGISKESLSRINQLISHAASQHIRSPLSVRTENIALENGKILIVVSIPKGIDKPYFDKNGIIWLKCGADKRRIKKTFLKC